MIRGYASPEGSKEVNERIARQRAEAVKDVLMKRYRINERRITAEGQGVGDMFSNRIGTVSAFAPSSTNKTLSHHTEKAVAKPQLFLLFIQTPLWFHKFFSGGSPIAAGAATEEYIAGSGLWLRVEQ